MGNIISIDGIEEAIKNLRYSNKNSPKYRLIHTIREYYSGVENVESIKRIDTDDLIRRLWDTGENQSAIKNRRKNLSSIKSSINNELKKLYKDGKNSEGIVVGPTNVFEMSSEAKDKILDSFKESTDGIGTAPMERIMDVLKVVNEQLTSPVAEDDKDGLKKLDQIKDLIKELSENIGLGDANSPVPDGKVVGTNDQEQEGPLDGFNSYETTGPGQGGGTEKPDDHLVSGGGPSEFGGEENRVDNENDLIDPDFELNVTESTEEEEVLEEIEDAEDLEEIEPEGAIEEDELERLEGIDPEDDFEELDSAEDVADDEIIEAEDESEEVGLAEDAEDDEVLEEVNEPEELEISESETDYEEVDHVDDVEGEVVIDEIDNKEDHEDDEVIEEEETGEFEEIEQEDDLEGIDLAEDAEAEEIIEEADLAEGVEEDLPDEVDDVGGFEEIEAEDDYEEVDPEEEYEEIDLAAEEEDEEILDEQDHTEELEEIEPEDDLAEMDLVEDAEDDEIIEETDLSEDMADDEVFDEAGMEDALEEDEIFEEADQEEDSEIDDEEKEIDSAMDFSFDELLEEYSDYGYTGEDGIRKAKYLAEGFNNALATMDRYYNQYIQISKGRYIVGSRDPRNGDRPREELEIDSFYLGKFPVTNALFEIFIEKTGYITTAERLGYGTVYHGRYQKIIDEETGLETLNWSSSLESKVVEGAYWYQPMGPGSTLHNKRSHPVVQVSREDAMAFAAWTGKRLPTENEWEAASRTTAGNDFPWGDEVNEASCNIEESYIGGTSSVDAFKEHANDFGIVDTIGNVLEWTLDHITPVSVGEKGVIYITKGGSWVSNREVSLSTRFKSSARSTSNILGFRCVAC